MLTVRALTTPLLRPVSFDLADGEAVAVQGPSGAGKSVLLRALADLDPSQGEVRLDGARREDMAAPRWRRLVRYLAAEPAWWDDRVAAHFPDWSTARPIAERLGLPGDIGAALVARLSTGERQRLALIRALAPLPRVLLADEPTAALDPAAVAAAEALIAERRSAGMAVLWVSHDAAQARRIATRLLRVDEGEVSEDDVSEGEP